MSDQDQPQFEQADAGSSHTFPLTAGNLKKGAHVMMKGKPCKIIEITVSKTGKHGHAKANITGIDIFTGKKYEDMCPCGHNVECPNIKRTEYTLMDVDWDSGDVSVLLENGDTKEDLNLPKETSGLYEEWIEEPEKGLRARFDNGDALMVTVLFAMGQEKVESFKNAPTS